VLLKIQVFWEVMFVKELVPHLPSYRVLTSQVF